MCKFTLTIDYFYFIVHCGHVNKNTKSKTTLRITLYKRYLHTIKKGGTLLKQNLHFLIPSRLFSNNNCNVGEYLFYDDSILKLPYLVQANSKKKTNKQIRKLSQLVVNNHNIFD